MDRTEHLAWCKSRALEYVEAGNLRDAVASMASDLNKHEGTAAQINGATIALGMFALQEGAPAVRRWIEGF